MLGSLLINGAVVRSRTVRRLLCVPQWALVQQQAYKVSLAGSLFFAGLLVGNIIFGPLSDRIGRRPVFLAGEHNQEPGTRNQSVLILPNIGI